MIRVIENEDGTCYPFSDSGLPVGRTKTKENSSSKHGERQAENNTMMRKVIELRRKMEGLSVQKRTRKPTKTEENDANLASSSGISSGETSPFSITSSFVPRTLGKRLAEVYTDRFLYSIQPQRNKTSIGKSYFVAVFENINAFVVRS